MERKLFLGANLPGREGSNGYEGTEKALMEFYNLKELYLLKGGSGLGKGTFMQKFAEAFKDCTVDYYYCSGDVKSLDGVIIKEKNIGMIDATPPHILDPIYPGLKLEEILDLAQFIMPEKMHTSREVIDRIYKEKGEYYKQANVALAKLLKSRGAKGPADVNTAGKIYKQAEALLIKNNVKKEPPIKAFARSVTSCGVSDFREGWAESPQKYIKIKCSEETADIVFKKLHEKYGGYAFLHYLEPDMLEGAAVGGFCFVLDAGSEKKTDTAALNDAIAALGRADKFMHGKMEAEYQGCVDFAKVDALFEQVVKQHRE